MPTTPGARIFRVIDTITRRVHFTTSLRREACRIAAHLHLLTGQHYTVTSR